MITIKSAREIETMARAGRDWHQLIEVCSLAGALLADVDLGRLARFLLHGVLAVERGPVQEHDDVGTLLRIGDAGNSASASLAMAP